MDNEARCVPEWLLPAFIRSMRTLGASDESAVAETGARLLERWGAPPRKFHTLKHLQAMLARLDELAESSHHPEALRVAAWYHGAVFEVPHLGGNPLRFGENYAASAALARTELAALGLDAVLVTYIAHLIEQIPHCPQHDFDVAALHDAEHAVLRSAPQRYREYRKQVGEEYAGVPELHFLVWRLDFIDRLLARPHLYLTAVAREWETAARENLESERAKATAQLQQLDPTGKLAAEVPRARGTTPGPSTPVPMPRLPDTDPLTSPYGLPTLSSSRAGRSAPVPSPTPRRPNDTWSSTLESCLEDIEPGRRTPPRPDKEPEEPTAPPEGEWQDDEADMGALIADQIAAARLGRREMVRPAREQSSTASDDPDLSTNSLFGVPDL